MWQNPCSVYHNPFIKKKKKKKKCKNGSRRSGYTHFVRILALLDILSSCINWSICPENECMAVRAGAKQMDKHSRFLCELAAPTADTMWAVCHGEAC